MPFGLENKKIALVGLDADISEAYLPYLNAQGITNILVSPGMVNVETLLERDACLTHLTHNESDIIPWVETLLVAHSAGLYLLVTLMPMSQVDAVAESMLSRRGVMIRSTSKYRQTFHELVDHLKMNF